MGENDENRTGCMATKHLWSKFLEGNNGFNNNISDVNVLDQSKMS